MCCLFTGPCVRSLEMLEKQYGPFYRHFIYLCVWTPWTFLPFDSPFYRNILGQTDSQTKKQTCIQKKIKVKEASACQKAIVQIFFCFFLPVVHKYVWTLVTSCHAKTSRNGLHHWWTRSGLVLFISLLISREKWKLSRSAQPGCNVQASVPYSLLGRLKFNLE